MSKQRCLYCYNTLLESHGDFHVACSKKIFGTATPPLQEYTIQQMLELAEKVIKSHTTITGVQPKLSLGFN
ncbi:MAG: hypothetical protein M3512_14915 [Bacteroidota bacterium]|nr:hypothetical protein [Bacteroidota bacterium]